MVRKSIIKILVVLLILQSCFSNKKKFYKENEILSVAKNIRVDKQGSFAFFLIRTSRCDLCTDAAREIFRSIKTESIALLDCSDSSFQNEIKYPNKDVIVKPSIYFEERGVDFGDNYLFFIKNGEISDYIKISKETKEDIVKLIENELID